METISIPIDRCKSEDWNHVSGTTKMVRLRMVLIGDTHYQEENMADDLSRIDQIKEIVQRYRPDLIVCLGDILHRFAKVNSFALTYAVDFLASLRDIAPLRIIVGNHDRPNNTDFHSDIHPFTACRHWSDTVVVDRAYREVFKGHQLLYLPYVFPGRMMESILTVEPDWATQYSNYSLVLMHQEMEGVKMGPQVSTSPDKWLIDWPLAGSGHIHDYHWYQSNYVYIGSTSQQTFAESRDKAIGLFDLDISDNTRTDLVPIEQPPVLSNDKWAFYRFPIKSAQRIKLEMTYQQLVQWTFSPQDWCLVLLHLTHAEHKTCISMISQLQKTNRRLKIKICYTDQQEQSLLTRMVAASVQERSFHHVITERLAQNPSAKELYDRLFASNSLMGNQLFNREQSINMNIHHSPTSSPTTPTTPTKSVGLVLPLSSPQSNRPTTPSSSTGLSLGRLPGLGSPISLGQPKSPVPGDSNSKVIRVLPFNSLSNK